MKVQEMLNALPPDTMSEGRALLYTAQRAYEIGFRDGKQAAIPTAPLCPKSNLDAEINRYCDSLGIVLGKGVVEGLFDYELIDLARHFAGWGRENYKNALQND